MSATRNSQPGDGSDSSGQQLTNSSEELLDTFIEFMVKKSKSPTTNIQPRDWTDVSVEQPTLRAVVTEELSNNRNQSVETAAVSWTTRFSTLNLNLKQFQESDLTIKTLAKQPGLMEAKKKSGQTALHILIASGEIETAKAMLETASEDQKEKLLNAPVKDVKFVGTIMEAELPLHISVLTLNIELVGMLINQGAPWDAKNSHEETAMHALVNHAVAKPDKEFEIADMLEKCSSIFPKSVWFIENGDRLTPLKLAAKRGKEIICVKILCLEGVYRFQHYEDGLFDTYEYDITELDTVSNALLFENRQSRPDSSSSSSTKEAPAYVPESKSSKTEQAAASVSNSKDRGESAKSTEGKISRSVLELLPVRHSDEDVGLMGLDVVRVIAQEKWKHLEKYFIIWLFIHLSMVVCQCVYAAYRDWEQLNVAEQTFVRLWPWFSVAVALLFIIIEFYGVYKTAQEFRPLKGCVLKVFWRLIKGWSGRGNVSYLLLLFFYHVFIVIDTFWHEFDNNYEQTGNCLLVFALLMGGTFLVFFLRVLRKFAFFTSLFEKLIFGDMSRFSATIIIQLLSFSMAMYIVFIPLRPEKAEGFQDVPSTILTMFRLMIGIDDVSSLDSAPAPWIAISLYVLFLLVTYILLLNSLIAMMSRTCEAIVRHRDPLWRKQRLAVMILLEKHLPPKFRNMIHDKVMDEGVKMRYMKTVKYVSPYSGERQDKHSSILYPIKALPSLGMLSRLVSKVVRPDRSKIYSLSDAPIENKKKKKQGKAKGHSVALSTEQLDKLRVGVVEQKDSRWSHIIYPIYPRDGTTQESTRRPVRSISNQLDPDTTDNRRVEPSSDGYRQQLILNTTESPAEEPSSCSGSSQRGSNTNNNRGERPTLQQVAEINVMER